MLVESHGFPDANLGHGTKKRDGPSCSRTLAEGHYRQELDRRASSEENLRQCRHPACSRSLGDKTAITGPWTICAV